jgi:hypothetical protein
MPFDRTNPERTTCVAFLAQADDAEAKKTGEAAARHCEKHGLRATLRDVP